MARNTANSRRQVAWRTCVALTIVMTAVAYSPLVIAPGETGPWLFGLPRTLWAGIALAGAVVAVTVIGAVVHPGEGDEAP